MQQIGARKSPAQLTSLRGTGYDPWEHAEELDLQVLDRPLGTEKYLWLPDHFTLVIQSCIGHARQRIALARGIGHAQLGHRKNWRKHKRQADEYAITNLIDHEELQELEQVSDDRQWISKELGITRRLLEVYLRQVC